MSKKNRKKAAECFIFIVFPVSIWLWSHIGDIRIPKSMKSLKYVVLFFYKKTKKEEKCLQVQIERIRRILSSTNTI